MRKSTGEREKRNKSVESFRLTVEESGCQTILTHSKYREILNHLIAALDINDPSRSTNAAFAIGRLIEGNDGKKTVIGVCGEEKLVRTEEGNSLHFDSSRRLVRRIAENVRSSRRERGEQKRLLRSQLSLHDSIRFRPLSSIVVEFPSNSSSHRNDFGLIRTRNGLVCSDVNRSASIFVDLNAFD